MNNTRENHNLNIDLSRLPTMPLAWQWDESDEDVEILTHEEIELIAPGFNERITEAIQNERNQHKLPKAISDAALMKDQLNKEIDELNRLQNETVRLQKELLMDIAEVSKLRTQWKDELEIQKAKSSYTPHTSPLNSSRTAQDAGGMSSQNVRFARQEAIGEQERIIRMFHMIKKYIGLAGYHENSKEFRKLFDLYKRLSDVEKALKTASSYLEIRGISFEQKRISELLDSLVNISSIEIYDRDETHQRQLGRQWGENLEKLN